MPESNTAAPLAAAETLFGYTESEAVGHALAGLVAKREDLRAEAARHFQVGLADQSSAFQVISKGTRKDGSLVDVELSVVPIIVQGKKQGLYALYHDITKLERARQEAEEARTAAEAANLEKSGFLSNVSHELRTPLTSVIGFTKVTLKDLEERVFPNVVSEDRKVNRAILQARESLSIIISEGERLTSLINDLLDLAKIESGKVDWKDEAVWLDEVVDHAVSATAALVDQKGLTLIREVEADLPPVTGDRDRLIQVVINLLSNAVKFTPHGTVTCRVQRAQNNLVVSVTDTGVGIAPEDQPKVFEKFKQVGDTLTDKPKGTGLGLPICHEIVKRHGGRLWLESELGKGSKFSFKLPLPAAESPYKE